MTKTNDGGPAFPQTNDSWFGSEGNSIVPSGMSLRDWYAGMALQQLCAGSGARMVADRDERYNETNWKEVVAANAYEFADAMLQERMKP